MFGFFETVAHPQLRHTSPTVDELAREIYARRQQRIADGEIEANPKGEPTLEEYLDDAHEQDTCTHCGSKIRSGGNVPR